MTMTNPVNTTRTKQSYFILGLIKRIFVGPDDNEIYNSVNKLNAISKERVKAIEETSVKSKELVTTIDEVATILKAR